MAIYKKRLIVDYRNIEFTALINLDQDTNQSQRIWVLCLRCLSSSAGWWKIERIYLEPL